MSMLVDKYGEFDSVYRGNGTINNVNCEFEVGQQSDGTIILYCSTDSVILDSESHDVELIGQTDRNKPISVIGTTMLENSSHIISMGKPMKYHWWYRSAGKINMGIGEFEWKNTNTIKFAVTNFVFWGNEVEQIGNKAGLNTLKLSLDGIDLSFRQLDAYNDIKKSLESKKNTAVTCELIIDTSSHSQEEIFEYVDTICTLLTIARGKKINWINYALYESEKLPIFIEHQPRITSSYQGYELIDFQDSETVSFLEQCYPTYKTLNSEYHFDYVANILVDVHSRGFLETRCLAMFSIVEFLAREVKLYGSLKSKIKAFVNHHKIPVSKREIDFFVHSRTFLVHELKFDSNNPGDEYVKNLHFLHRLILGTLGYESYYLNVTKHPLHTGSREDKLTPTS